MKRIIASAGLVAVGVAATQAAAPGLSPIETVKPWSISATLRGFYDDNYAAVNRKVNVDRDSFGFEVRPAVAVNFPMEQTFIGAAYIYSLRWYADRDRNSADHSHELTLKADHAFSELYKISFDDSFVYSQEPTLIDENVQTTFRTDADAFRNRGTINFDARLTPLLGLGLGYENGWYDYRDSGFGSRSALLDRFEHRFHIDGRWHARENLVGLLGYQYGIFDFTSKEEIAPGFIGDDRDNVSHYFYVGAEQSLSSQLKAEARIGAAYTDYDRLPGDSFSPYALIQGTYTYLPGSYVQFGFRQDHNATDIARDPNVLNPTADQIVTDQETSALYASVSHRITPRLTGSLVSQYQRSVFNNGSLDGDIDNFLLLGLNFEYRFNPNWSTELGYNFDRLDSDVKDRSFTRNRVYAGVRATY
jgi:hypothetical protein